MKPILTLCLLAIALSPAFPAAAESEVVGEPVSAAATPIVTYVRNARRERVGSGDLSRRHGGVARGNQKWSAVAASIDPASARELQTGTGEYAGVRESRGSWF